MVAQAVDELPNECCGILAGTIDPDQGLACVRYRYPLVNALASPTRYLTEDRSLIAAHRAMRQQGADVLAFYHSHPTSDPVPSATDLEQHAESLWADCAVIHFIISLKSSPPRLQAWWLGQTDYCPAEWEYQAEG